ncbi:MAG: hypothetical protein GY803_10870, partial [Chloroflexi bacterium]|nr:hypothetical protein [Chloroflexota bacterium]
VVPDKWQSPSRAESWSEERLLARYSDRLLADILVPLAAADGDWPGLTQALLTAQREQARILALAVGLDDVGMEERFYGRCQEANIGGHLLQEAGDLAEKICQRAVLTDLIALDGHFDVNVVQTVLQNCAWPVLIVPGKAANIERVLLAYEGRRRSQEALFVAAYLGEQWGAALTVLTTSDTSEYAARYLAMHEVEAAFVKCAAITAVSIQQTATVCHSDLIILNQNGGRQFKNVIAPLLEPGARSLFICP